MAKARYAVGGGIIFDRVIIVPALEKVSKFNIKDIGAYELRCVLASHHY
jgi:hypothetical protein